MNRKEVRAKYGLPEVQFKNLSIEELKELKQRMETIHDKIEDDLENLAGFKEYIEVLKGTKHIQKGILEVDETERKRRIAEYAKTVSEDFLKAVRGYRKLSFPLEADQDFISMDIQEIDSIIEGPLPK